MVLTFLYCENVILPYIKIFLWKEYLTLDVMFVNFSKTYFTSLFIAFIIWNLSKETLGKNVKLHIFFLFFLRVRIYFYWSIIALQKLHKVLPYNKLNQNQLYVRLYPLEPSSQGVPPIPPPGHHRAVGGAPSVIPASTSSLFHTQ